MQHALRVESEVYKNCVNSVCVCAAINPPSASLCECVGATITWLLWRWSLLPPDPSHVCVGQTQGMKLFFVIVLWLLYSGEMGLAFIFGAY